MAAGQDAGQGGGHGGAGGGAIGIVLAGGRAERLGGIDKCLLEVGGRPILAQALAVLRPHLPAIVISANGAPERFAAFGCPVLPDLPSLQGAGPLAGLAAFAAAFPGRPAICVPGDTPFLPADLVPRLRAAAGTGTAYAGSAGRAHPTIAAHGPGDLARLPGWLAAGGRAAMGWLAHVGAVPVDWPVTGDADPFMNVNRPADLEAARRRAVATTAL